MNKLKKFLSLFLAVTLLLTSIIIVVGAKTTNSIGDINCDGKVSAADARLVLRFSVSLEKPTEEQKKSADVNGDGKVTASDARMILRVSVGLDKFDIKEDNTENNNKEDTVINNNKIIIAINEKDFSTKTGNLTISGTVTFSDKLSDTVYIRYDTYSEDDFELKQSVFSEQTIAKDNTWEFKNVHVLPGNSTVVISAIIGEIIHKETIHAYFDQGERYNEVNEENVKYDEALKTKYINNIITIFANDNSDENKLNAILKNFGGEIVGRSSNIYDVKLNNEYTLDEIEAICDKLEKYNEISFAHAHYVTNITNNTSIRDSINAYEIWEDTGNWGIEAIEVPSAWNYKERFSEINIGVVDTGFDLDHEDLIGKLYPATDNMEKINDYNYWNTDEQVEKINSHGTIVAGIIGAINDKKGITGILDNANIIYSDWQPNETKLKQSWDIDTAVFQSLVDSVKSGAKIINYSLASSAPFNYNDFFKNFNCNKGDINQPQEWKDKQAEIASEYILSLLRDEYDFLIVQAAGNGWKVEVENDKWEQIAVDATNSGFWSCITENNIPNKVTEQEKQYILDSIIVVGNAKKNSDGNYQQATSSNGGKRVDICAPGTDIFSTEVNNYYGYSSGTSVAAPHVTGVCGMVWSVNPNFTGAEVKEIVCNYTSITVHDNPDGNHPLNNTYPMVNAKLAVEEAIRRTDNSGSISGLVKDVVTDKPIQSVKVTVKIDQTERYVKTDKNGNFELVLPEGEYELIVEMDGYATKRISEKCKKDVETVLLDTIYLTPTSYLMGTVIDKETNKPVEDASVLLQKIDEAGLIVGEYVCSTDKDGKFEISVPVGNYTYTINKLDMTNELYEDATGTVTVNKADGNILDTVYLSPKDTDNGEDNTGDSGDTEERTVIDSGNCGADGDNVTWTLYEDGELIISGSGEMNNFVFSSSVPWYSNWSYIKYVTIKNGITSIGDNSFACCTRMTTIKIPASVDSIGKYAFIDYTRNTSIENIIVDFDNQYYSSEDGVLFDKNKTVLILYPENNSRKSYDIPKTVKTILKYAFSQSKNLESINIPDSVSTIEVRAFDACKHLENIVVNNSNQYYSSENGVLFDKNKTNLIQYPIGNRRVSYTIPNEIKIIQEFAFYECTNLQLIEMSFGVTSIGKSAFSYCESLISIEIPDSVTSIGEGAFYYCPSLASINIPSDIININDHTFTHCSSLTSIEIPNSVKYIGVQAFDYCKKLTSIEIPVSVNKIEMSAFSSYQKSITIKNKYCNIQTYAINNNGGTLEDIIIYGYLNSTAQTYAENNNIIFVALD